MSDNRLPEGFRLQAGCHNCRHCAMTWDHDEGRTFWCAFDAPPRPPCGSVAMGERLSFLLSDKEVRRQRHMDWEEWSEGRQTSSHGICPQWEEKG